MELPVINQHGQCWDEGCSQGMMFRQLCLRSLFRTAPSSWEEQIPISQTAKQRPKEQSLKQQSQTRTAHPKARSPFSQNTNTFLGVSSWNISESTSGPPTPWWGLLTPFLPVFPLQGKEDRPDVAKSCLELSWWIIWPE